jgi:DNA-binding beta-propeller fold protein YncE
VVNVSRAEQDPAHSIIAKSAAGCSPVRLVLSPYGERAYVTARSDNALLIFDTRKLISDTPHARIASIPVGNAPVGVAAIEQGLKIVVANSNRFSDNGKNQNLSVIDANNKLMGVIPAQLFPRELRLTPDDRTLLVTNFTSKTLEFVDLAQSPIQVVK